MPLSDLIRKNPSLERCDSDSCDSCDTWGENGGTVAGVASVVVANHTDEKTEETETARRLWTITEPDGSAWTSSFTPPQTQEQVLERYPPGTRAEPCQSATQPPTGALSASQAALVGAALDAIGESDQSARREVLDQCAADPAALRFWLARHGARWHALYRRWLEGITEPQALVTLNTEQVREAVAAGIVTRAQAKAGVLLLYRVPPGEHAPGAVGLLAIPSAHYRDFSPRAALEALQWQH